MWATPSALPVPRYLAKSLGHWGGMAIIAIGPKGGKIVGYGSGGKPIYAGSVKAQKLVAQTVQSHTTDTQKLQEIVNQWLVEIGVPNKVLGDEVLTNDAAGQMILDSYGVKPKSTGPGAWRFSLHLLKQHAGKPLVPHGAEKTTWAAKAASGELDKDPFPQDLSVLKEVPAGKAAGSHGNRLFKSPDGRQWLFKTHNDKIARAEEAASRLGRLVFGPDYFAAAKYVKLAGKDGVLLEWKSGDEIPQNSYHQTTETFIGQHFEQFVEHQVFDWLISNHDSHAGNFLVKDGKLIAIDKGQAWRFFVEDELSADYSPNPSKPVYVKLWGIEDLHQHGDPFAAASRVLARIDKISPEQFREIVGPYVATRAKNEGIDAKKLLDAMTSRLTGLRSDWIKFLAGVTHSDAADVTASLKPPSPDNFETMPEVEAKKVEEKLKGAAKLFGPPVGKDVWDRPIYKFTATGGKVWTVQRERIVVPKLRWGWKATAGDTEVVALNLDKLVAKMGLAAPAALVEPDKPLVIEGGAKAPIVEKPAAGWPQTIGKVTIAHPGNPPPPGWPSGYPGPGFQTSVIYKKQHYDIEFKLVDSKPAFQVFYPDGTDKTFDSPNKASDSLYLYHQKLPLDMNATAKKAKGISYPASKAFGILAFKQQLAEAQGNDQPAATQTVAELEANGLVQKDQATVPAELPKSLESLTAPESGKAPTVEDLAELPPGTVVHFSVKPPAGQKPGIFYAATKGPGGGWDLVRTAPTDAGWVATNAVGSYSNLGTFLTDPSYGDYTVEAPGSVATVPKPKKTKKTKVNPPNVQTPTLATMPTATHPKLNDILPAAIEWSAKLPDQGGATTPIGSKPTTWNPWVPPPGVMIEAQIGDKRYWLITAVTGHSPVDGEANAQVRIALLDQDGNVHAGDKANGKQAIKSLANAALKAGLSMSTQQLKEAWRLNEITFLPGETFASVRDGTGPSSVPAAPAKAADVPVLNQKIVKHTVSLAQALQQDPLVKQHGIEIKQGPKTFDLVVNGVEGADQIVQQLIAKYGLGDVVEAQKILNPSTAWASFPIWALNHDIVETATVYEVTSKPQPVGADNFATMPDYVPQTIKSNASKATIQKILDGVPSGTTLVAGDFMMTKGLDGGWFNVETDAIRKDPATSIAGLTTTVVPPGATIPQYNPPTYQPKVEWNAKAALVAKQEAAKAVASWSKQHPAVEDARILRGLAHLQAAAGPMELWARMMPDGRVAVGSDAPGFKKFWTGLQLDSKPTKTPLGRFQTFEIDQLEAKVPGAGTIVGPDDLNYPAGTTFTQEVVQNSVRDLMEREPGFYKWADHKTNPLLQVLKVKGKGPEQIEAAKAIAAKFNLTMPSDPKVGGSNVIAEFQKAALDVVAKTWTRTLPQLAKAPPPFRAKALPLGSASLGDAAPVNRQDLAVIASMTMGLAGHAIRMGHHGIFRDGQVYFRRVRDLAGKVWIEAFGTFEKPDIVPDGLKHGSYEIRSTAGTSVPGYGYLQQTYDAANDVQVEQGNLAKSFDDDSHVGATTGGSTIAVVNRPSALSVHGSFAVRMAVGADHQQELAQAFKMMGQDVEATMAEPTTEDVRKTTKLAALRAIKGPASWISLDHEKILDESWLDQELAAEGDIGADTLAGAEWRWVGPGRQAPVIDDTEAAKKRGAAFVYVGMSGVGAVVARLREGNIASNKRKHQTGVVGNASSAKEDESRGGSWSVFTRLGNLNANPTMDWGYRCETLKPKLVFHPRVLNRLDWYGHSSDMYGSTQSGSSSRYDAMGFTAENNEILFQDTMALRDLAGIMVDSQEKKAELLKLAKEAGVPDTINGFPLETFVVVTMATDRKVVAKLMPGLQEGALP